MLIPAQLDELHVQTSESQEASKLLQYLSKLGHTGPKVGF